MTSQSPHNAFTLAWNNGRSCASYLVVLVSGSSNAIFFAPPPPPPPGLLVVAHPATTSTATAATTTSRATRPTRTPNNLPTLPFVVAGFHLSRRRPPPTAAPPATRVAPSVHLLGPGRAARTRRRGVARRSLPFQPGRRSATTSRPSPSGGRPCGRHGCGRRRCGPAPRPAR